MNALQSLMNVAPTAIVCILGIIFALVQREKAPKAATLVVISLIILLVLTLLRPFGASVLVRMEMGKMLWAYYLVCRLIDLATTAGLIFAVFCDRELPPLSNDPYAKNYSSFPPAQGPSFSGPAPLPPLGGPMRPPQ